MTSQCSTSIPVLDSDDINRDPVEQGIDDLKYAARIVGDERDLACQWSFLCGT
jgi:hypothetical protein